jgi:hypothetical protein
MLFDYFHEDRHDQPYIKADGLPGDLRLRKQAQPNRHSVT